MNAAQNVVPFVGPDPRLDADRQRAARMAVVVHDFRQPLNAIEMSARVLGGKMPTADEGIRTELERIWRAVKALTRMSSDLLDASAMETKHLTIDPVAVRIAALATEAIASVPNLRERCEVHIGVDADRIVFVDPQRIVQVLANLLTNAVKYGDAIASITVDITSTRDEVRVSVSNRGAGISATELPHVFESFYRADEACRRPGLGLGLTIAKAIVEAHGGRIGASSLPGVVTQVGFTLPLRALK